MIKKEIILSHRGSSGCLYITKIQVNTEGKYPGNILHPAPFTRQDWLGINNFINIFHCPVYTVYEKQEKSLNDDFINDVD